MEDDKTTEPTETTTPNTALQHSGSSSFTAYRLPQVNFSPKNDRVGGLIDMAENAQLARLKPEVALEVVALSKMKATMNQELLRGHIELERERIRAEVTMSARHLWFSAFALVACGSVVAALVHLRHDTLAMMIATAFIVLVSVLLGRRLDLGVIERVVRVLRPELPQLAKPDDSRPDSEKHATPEA